MSEQIEQRISALRRITEDFSIDFQINVINRALQSETELASMETYVAEQVAEARAKTDEQEELERRETAERDSRHRHWLAQRQAQMRQQASKPKKTGRSFAEIAAAYHEAGHLAALHHFGMPVKGAEIDTEGSGRVWHDDEKFPLAQRATMIAAGTVAEKFFCPGLGHLIDTVPVTDDSFIYSDDDRPKVARIAALDQITFPSGQDSFEIASELAAPIMPRYRRAVVALAHALMNRGKLSGPEVEKIIGAYPPEPPTEELSTPTPPPVPVVVRQMATPPPPITVLAQAAPAQVVVQPQPPPVVIHVNVTIPATKRRMNLKRDSAGDITSAEVETEVVQPLVTVEKQF